MSLKITQVDSFTAEAYKGNPAAVCILDKQYEDSWYRNVAKEMNLSETAFLLKQEDCYNLRWFTPAAEVDLCGHATLASAHVLWESGYLEENREARFHTRSGLLIAVKDGSWIYMNFPLQPSEPADDIINFMEILGEKPKYVGKAISDYLVELESEDTVNSLAPDFTAIAGLEARGVIVTARADGKAYDFVSRFFAPRIGVNEDPVTGSAHCTLAPFWGSRLNKKELLGYQSSERGGFVRVRMEGDRVVIGGQAVTTLKGELLY